ncbi:MAG TPA: hypothetical protein VLH75_09060 [Longimicrobiales bacterium]|nr:hypothetical protein [Longimicrobiales bacterium]
MPTFPLVPGRLALLFGAGIALVACSAGPDPGLKGLGEMRSHYRQVEEIQGALVAGRVDDTRDATRWLSTHEGREYAAEAGPALEAMRNEARTMLRQRDILLMSRTLGRMGVACGDCHVALGTQVAFSDDEPPRTSANPQAQMLRHAWAMDRLWKGLVGPSEAAWKAGAGALLTMPVDFGGNEEANRLSARVHELAGIAQVSTTPKERSDTYGDLLETCALCHDALRISLR